ncbi:MarR family winged helix-turn-helix transcriptional regulator [Loigolactobacillus bifermentans]|jgi:DNA-binding MarR family transcriptional regulator|uniref:HTH marR-type domain-containing protein n=1 Tax=Loigolactobacillus bifermentans DSM 20003 TaxID=1423726 RepID=A0A0R1GZR4_9LACO|nr:MarR family winged helix-turn-helix transcriptional regulator [Loigolactobacillus bifermentans]KRK39869.1 hypothetical protein FC07_GL002184 [Loigolactobacillus bifermentans DSM 20003]QGG60465.1 MarR family transcriptional regulator [Loigolactobacillus bifermentans]
MQANEFGPLIKAIDTEIQKHINNGLAGAPKGLPRITGTQMAVLGYLYDRPHAVIYQSNLENEFNLSRPTINGLIKRLKDAGQLEVITSETDRRYKQIRLTDVCRLEMARHKPEFDADIQQMEAQMTAGMTSQEVEQMRQWLRQMLTNMRQSQ